MRNNTNAQILAKLDAIATMIEDHGKRLDALEAKASKTVSATASKGSRKSAPSPKAKTTKDAWGKYSPKKDADGFYNWRSYKAARNRYLEDNGYGYDKVGWMSKEEFAKACKPWTDHFGEYTKKSDR